MATLHVIYDPTDRLQIGPPDRLPPKIKFIAMKCDDLPEPEGVAELAGELAEMLLEQISK